MSQATKPNTTTPSRRALLAGAPAVAAALATGTAVNGIATAMAAPSVDPIFAVIAEHRAAVKARSAALMATYGYDTTPDAAALAGGIGVITGTQATDADMDWPATVARAKQMIDSLRSWYGPKEWTATDEEGAARVLRYVRDGAAGLPENETEWVATIEFFRLHYQSVDWVFFGDPDCMIAFRTARSPRAAAADPAFEAIAACERAWAASEGQDDKAAFDEDPACLGEVVPTTGAGAAALIRYVLEHDTVPHGGGWGSDALWNIADSLDKHLGAMA